MSDPEEVEVHKHLIRLSMRSKIILLVTPFILCTLLLSVKAGPFLMDLMMGIEVEEENMPETNTSETGNPDVYFTILDDEFDNLIPFWTEWMMNTGNSSLSDGTYLLTISNESNRIDESIAALYDYTTFLPEGVGQNAINTMPWLYRGVEIRLRCSNDNGLESGIGGGQRWWGFIDFLPNVVPMKKSALYFKSKSPDCERGAGFLVESIVNGNKMFQKNLTGIDMREWHNYTIIWKKANATFLVDGEIVVSLVGAEMVPRETMATYVMLGDIINSRDPFILANLTVDQWIEIDYVHIFYADEGVYQNESQYISDLFVNASGVIDWVEEENLNSTTLRSFYSMAENNWTYYRLPQTEESLEYIISQRENFEVAKIIRDNDLFELAEEAIQKAESEGRERQVLPMRSNLENAKKYWEWQNYKAVKELLDIILRSTT